MQFLFTASEAFAQAADAAPAKGPSLIETLTLPVGFLFIMYFLIIRPQQKKAKEQAELLTNLKPGDEVVTTGGIIGKIRAINETFVTIEASQNTTLKVMKANVQAMTKAPATAAAAKDQPVKA